MKNEPNKPQPPTRQAELKALLITAIMRVYYAQQFLRVTIHTAAREEAVLTTEWQELIHGLLKCDALDRYANEFWDVLALHRCVFDALEQDQKASIERAKKGPTPPQN